MINACMYVLTASNIIQAKHKL